MNINSTTTDPVEAVLVDGLKDLWYAVCPSEFVGLRPVSLHRFGKKIALWRDMAGKVHALEDHCPHRGAPLSQGIILGDRLACIYHGVEVRCDGTVTKVPGSPGCKLEGSRPTLSFHVRESHGAIFLYNSDVNVDTPPAMTLPDELSSPEYSNFLCYIKWKGDYRYALDNLMDPMHGTFLHKQSHSMSQGESTATFQIRTTDAGFVFEKTGQRGVNFDWSEFGSTGIHWVRLEIPYPRSGGPGGSFGIVGCLTPISDNLYSVFFWRCRKVSSWHRDTWRFLYRNRLEARHWAVLEQDRVMMEQMELDANRRENLYQHDMGVVRVRRHMRNLAKEQIEAANASKTSTSV
jgi:phenylpropionate dioxygenase-like ring-hydroxylating dioxygenase large terminal subunit